MFADLSARELTWWPEHVLVNVARAVDGAWQAWTRDWVQPITAIEPATTELAHEESGASAISHWLPLGAKGAACAWLAARASIDPAAQVQALLFDRPRGLRDGTLASDVARRAIDELVVVLGSSLRLAKADVSAPERSLFVPWSGAVCVQLAAGDDSLTLLLSRECVAALQPPPALASGGRAPSLSPVTAALSQQTVTLTAYLADLQVELGTLAQVTEGDILPLAHRLDQPVAMVDGAGTCVLRGFLGGRDHHKAVQLVRAGAPNITS